jgi:hypothetical protein
MWTPKCIAQTIFEYLSLGHDTISIILGKNILKISNKKVTIAINDDDLS